MRVTSAAKKVDEATAQGSTRACGDAIRDVKFEIQFSLWISHCQA